MLFGDGSETGGVGWMAQVVLSGSGGVSFGGNRGMGGEQGRFHKHLDVIVSLFSSRVSSPVGCGADTATDETCHDCTAYQMKGFAKH